MCGNFSEIWDAVYCNTLDAAVARAVLREAAGHKWAVGSIDIKSAFLNAKLPEDRVVVVTPPRALVEMGLVTEGQYWLLSRALYGLRECPRLWDQERDAQLKHLKVPLSDKEASLVQSVTDPSLWTVTCNGQVLAKLCTYVDDMLVTGPSHVVHAVLNAIGRLWQSSEPTVLEALDQGQTWRFCGVDVERLADGGLRLHQKRYLQDLMAKWGLGEAKPAST